MEKPIDHDVEKNSSVPEPVPSVAGNDKEFSSNDEDSSLPATLIVEPNRYSSQWSMAINRIHATLIHYILEPVAVYSATHARAMVCVMTGLAIGLMVTGLMTNFYINVNFEQLWTPSDAVVLKHEAWIKGDQVNFQKGGRYSLNMILHASGGNVIQGKETVQRMFQAIERIQQVPSYNKFCIDTNETTSSAYIKVCDVWGPLRFWPGASKDVYEAQVATDEDAIRTLSAGKIPEGLPIPDQSFYGYPIRDETTNLLTSAKSINLYFTYPRSGPGRVWGHELIKAITDLDEEWKNDPNTDFRIEVTHVVSMVTEFISAIVRDLPLCKCCLCCAAYM